MSEPPTARPAAIPAGVPRPRSIGPSSRAPAIAAGARDAARTPGGVTGRRSITGALPAGSATSSALAVAGVSGERGRPSSHGTSVAWPEDETGRSSVAPWRSPRPSASGTRIGGGRRAGAPPAPPLEEVVHGEDHDGRRHGVVDVVQRVLPVLPVLARLLADDREEEDPRQAPEEGEDREPPERHPRDAGGQRDERADDREHPREEHGPAAPALEPAVRALEVALLHVELAAVLLEQLHAPEVADGVGDPRAHDVRGHADGHRR